MFNTILIKRIGFYRDYSPDAKSPFGTGFLKQILLLSRLQYHRGPEYLSPDIPLYQPKILPARIP